MSLPLTLTPSQPDCSIAETKGRTYAELDILFGTYLNFVKEKGSSRGKENKVAARKFAKTKISTLVEGTEGAQMEQADRIGVTAVTAQGQGLMPAGV